MNIYKILAAVWLGWLLVTLIITAFIGSVFSQMILAAIGAFIFLIITLVAIWELFS